MESQASARSMGRTLAGRTRLEMRTSWAAIVWPGAFAFVMTMLLPVENAWIAAATGAVFAIAFVVCIALGEARRRRDEHAAPPDLTGPRDVVLERSSTIEQFGHAFARVAMVLASFSAGAYTATLLGF